ncbi:hypothetical protein VE02_08374 [Pseudogymnoascus sp. 03VT05]|nr:hypothetical protein VE02_08374 [Pseudogymnoascus sp. 03VT05]
MDFGAPLAHSYLTPSLVQMEVIHFETGSNGVNFFVSQSISSIPRALGWRFRVRMVTLSIGSIDICTLSNIRFTNTELIRCKRPRLVGTENLPNGGIIQTSGTVQEILFLEISLTENWLIFVTRGGKSWPSCQLIGAILVVDVIATLFCIFGWIAGTPEVGDPFDTATFSTRQHTDVVTVVVIWCYSIDVTIVLAIVNYLLNKISWLDNLGRVKRSRSDTAMENIIGHLSKLAIEHEQDENGGSRYQLTAKASDLEVDE